MESIGSVLPWVDDFTVPSRNRTLLLMKLNLAAYPTCAEGASSAAHQQMLCGYPSDTMTRLWHRGHSIYGPTISTVEQETAAATALQEANWKSLMSNTDDNHNNNDNRHASTTTSWIQHSIPCETAEFEVGVQALEYTIIDNAADTTTTATATTILAFRGTYSEGDYANIENWITPYILERSTARMRQAWTEDAGLEWASRTATTQESNNDDRWAKLEIRTGESYIFGRDRPLKEGRKKEAYSFPHELVEAVAANSSLAATIKGRQPDGQPFSVAQAIATGYWELTKTLVDEVAARAAQANRTLLLTGHSQGGTRAQLASMHLRHTTGVAHETITFAATGAACVSRLLFDHAAATTNQKPKHHATLLDDVNPFLSQDQMTEYVHPLDPWGNAMLGVDNGGQVCFFGTSRLLAAAAVTAAGTGGDGNDDRDWDHVDPAFTYCAPIYGKGGPALIAIEAGLGGDADLKRYFQQCRYFTHTAESMILNLLRVEGEEKSSSSGIGEDVDDDLRTAVVLYEDGTTDGGCRPVPVILQDDPQGVCPTGQISWEEEETIVEIVMVVLVALWLWCAMCALLCHQHRRRCRSSLGRDSIMLQQQEEDEQHDGGEPHLATTTWDDDSGMELPNMT